MLERLKELTVTPLVLQPCIYRAERSPLHPAPQFGRLEVVCKAMGGKSLGRRGEDDASIAEICNSCTIPLEAAFRPCLFLVPMKVKRKGALKDYFTCRWFYRLQPERPYEKAKYMCGGCPYWFPMPPIELLRDLERAAKKMIDYHTNVWENPPPPPAKIIWVDRPRAPKSFWRRTCDVLIRWWGW